MFRFGQEGCLFTCTLAMRRMCLARAARGGEGLPGRGSRGGGGIKGGVQGLCEAREGHGSACRDAQGPGLDAVELRDVFDVDGDASDGAAVPSRVISGRRGVPLVDVLRLLAAVVLLDPHCSVAADEPDLCVTFAYGGARELLPQVDEVCEAAWAEPLGA